jgi:hypothetical protein
VVVWGGTKDVDKKQNSERPSSIKEYFLES